MRFFKLAVISLIVLSVLITALSALIPSHVRISRAINIFSDDPGSMISDLRQWKNWNGFVQPPGNEIRQHIASKASIRTGDLTIVLISASADTVKTLWKQVRGNQFHATFNFIRGPEYTTVQWYFDFRLHWYPWEKFQSIIYDREMGPVMESSLAELKSLLETSP